MKHSVEHVVSSGNVFADLGLPDAQDLLVKSNLAHQIGTIIAHRHLNQTEAAAVLGTTQPKVSDLLRGRLDGFSIERLIRFLNALDRDVRIVISPKPRTQPRGRLSVDASTRANAARARASAPKTVAGARAT